jgi:hypothetical protein
MGSRRPSLEDVLSLAEYREALRTAAKIEDRVESLTIFFLLRNCVGVRRYGSRTEANVEQVLDVTRMRVGWYGLCQCNPGTDSKTRQ